MSDTAAPIAPTPTGARPPGANAALVLNDGSVYWGKGAGIEGVAVGEVCFNTSLTGYQEILTDPSYAGQIITFTFPHIGNVGVNEEDKETTGQAARGCVLRADITDPANWRSAEHLNKWLIERNLVGITGVDTRQLTKRIRDGGAPSGVVVHTDEDIIDIEILTVMAKAAPSLEGMDLAKDVTCKEPYEWTAGTWTIEDGHDEAPKTDYHVVAMDFGAKHNILRCLASAGCK